MNNVSETGDKHAFQVVIHAQMAGYWTHLQPRDTVPAM